MCRQLLGEEIPGSTNKKIPPARATSNWGPSPGSSGSKMVYRALVHKYQLFRVVILGDLNLVFGLVLLYTLACNEAILLECKAPSV